MESYLEDTLTLGNDNSILDVVKDGFRVMTDTIKSQAGAILRLEKALQTKINIYDFQKLQKRIQNLEEHNDNSLIDHNTNFHNSELENSNKIFRESLKMNDEILVIYIKI